MKDLEVETIWGAVEPLPQLLGESEVRPVWPGEMERVRRLLDEEQSSGAGRAMGRPLARVVLHRRTTAEETGEIFFTGNAFSDLLDYQFGNSFDWCHLAAAVRVASAAEDGVRDVDLNVVWNVDGEAVNAAAGDGTGAKSLKKETFEGVLLTMDAIGVARVSNPLVSGNEASATQADSPAVMWDTSVSANLLTKGPSTSDGLVSASSAELAASSTSTGYWTGFWTWSSSTQTFYWTWVWVWNSSGYQVS